MTQFTSTSAPAHGARHVGRAFVIPRSGAPFIADIEIAHGLAWCSACARMVNGHLVPMGDRLLNLREIREIRPDRAAVAS